MKPSNILTQLSTITDEMHSILLRMTVYGLILGSIAGTLVAIVFFSTVSDEPIIYGMSSLVFGGALGFFFGSIAGGASGLLMMVVTAIVFPRVHYVIGFRFIMGLIAGITTTIIFWLFGLWKFFTGTWSYEIIISVIIAVYASQIVAKKYINETSLNKKKKGTP